MRRWRSGSGRKTWVKVQSGLPGRGHELDLEKGAWFADAGKRKRELFVLGEPVSASTRKWWSKAGYLWAKRRPNRPVWSWEFLLEGGWKWSGDSKLGQDYGRPEVRSQSLDWTLQTMESHWKVWKDKGTVMKVIRKEPSAVSHRTGWKDRDQKQENHGEGWRYNIGVGKYHSTGVGIRRCGSQVMALTKLRDLEQTV